MFERFVYLVGEHAFGDTEAFGEAWRDAKAMAGKLHAPIYREVYTTRYVGLQVYLTGGMFVNCGSEHLFTNEVIKVF